MPKSKRTRVVHLTETSKRSTREHKTKYIDEVRTAVDKHDTLYLFSFENMRSNKFKQVRMQFRANDMDEAPSRIFLGKNKLLQVALGRTPEDEYSDNLRQVSKRITGGSVGLLFTCRSPAEVEDYFANLCEPDFARAGFVAPRAVTIQLKQLAHFPVSMVEQFRTLGLPTKVDNGTIILMDGKQEHRICKEGETLSAEQCKLLTQFDQKIAEFKVKLECRWTRSSGQFDHL
ncbi:turnover protein 4 homolog [Seminavis robusta]|uniref:Ribosome assembly factor mrt4 n=1 Tax=Seminavis robusta TaxID=568900 RepID=A0A9N8HW37_9STRA|nr:turnover protein 4 homolog [Seminavis robusta]|eukprot:Sro2516_g329950.1 turnover protein 4 homolog (231) ;mRNA; f:9078-9864